MVQNDSILPRHNDGTIPHFPNFRLKQVQGSICDSLIFENTAPTIYQPAGYNLFPNPANRIAYISLSGYTPESIHVLDIYGRETKMPVQISTTNIELDITGLATGCYTVMLLNNGSVITRKLIKY